MCLHVQDDTWVDLDKGCAIDDVLKLIFECSEFGVVGRKLFQQMNAESFDLIPNGIELGEVVFEHVEVFFFEGEFVLIENNLINLVVPLFPNQYLKN